MRITNSNVKSRPQRYLSRITAISVGLFFSTGSYAATSEEQAQLNTLTVTAQGENVHAVSAADIEQFQARDIRDVFKLSPDINIGGGVSNAQKIYLRGIEDVNLNITIDGARQNVNLFHHQGRMNLDPDLLKSVAVEAGPGSADQGYAALGGSIAFVTKDADDFLSAGEKAGVRVKAGYADADASTSGYIAAFGKPTDELGLLAYVKQRDSNNISAGDDETIPDTAGEQESYLLKASHNSERGHRFTVSAESHTDEGNYNNRANFPWQSNVQLLSAAMRQQHSRDSYVISHGYSDGNPMLDLKTRVYRNETAIDYLDALPMWLDEASSQSTGGDISNVFTFDGLGATHQLKLGLDYIKDETLTVLSSGASFAEEADNVGLFIQDRIQFSSAKLSLGARFDHFSTDYANGASISGEGVSPNATLEVFPAENLAVSIGYGESIRGAQLNQNLWTIPARTIPGLGLSSDFNVDGLDPERAKKWELGAKYEGQNLLTDGDQFYVGATVYSNRIENFAKYDTTGPVINRLVNAEGDVESEGYEARLGWASGGLSTTLSFNHTTMRDEFGQPFGDSGLQTMRKGSNFGDKWVLNGLYQFDNANVELGYTLTHVAKLTDVAVGSTEKPGYTLHDIYVFWQPLPNEPLQLRLSVNNLTDESYAEHTTLFINGEGTKEAGRDIRFTASYQF